MLTKEEEDLLEEFSSPAPVVEGQEEKAVQETVVDEPEEIVEEQKEEVVEEKVIDNSVEAETPTNDFTPVELKSKNVKIQVDSLDELVKLATQGLDYTKKTQMLSPYRAKIKTIEANGITDDDLVLLKDAKGGDVAAFKQLMSQAGIEDVYDIDSNEDKYNPTSLEQVSDAQIESEDIIAEIQGDTTGSAELIELTQTISDKPFIDALGSDTVALKAFYNDVKNGVAKEAVSEATKLSALNPAMSFGQAYVQSAMKIYGSKNETVTEEVVTPAVKEDVPLSKKMKSGLNNGSRSNANNGGSLGIDDIMDMADDDFMNQLDDILKK